MDERARTNRHAGSSPWVIAHRGASGSAPENTIPAFLLALEQRPTYIEYDVQPTRDGVLVCFHDETLERTTNVAAIFPSRYRVALYQGRPVARWYLEDFTFAEVRQLDAGRWFGESFRHTRIPSHVEAIEAIRGRAGLFIELKKPERYAALGIDVEGILLQELHRFGLDHPHADPATPVAIHSFNGASLRRLARAGRAPLPLHMLLGLRGTEQWASPSSLRRIRSFATGISPNKRTLWADRRLAHWAHAAGLAITPYTFSARAAEGYASLRAELKAYLDAVPVDGIIIDDPEHAPRTGA